MSDESLTETQSLLRHRLKFLGLIGVFLSPFILGWLALYVFDIKPKSGNYGTLVQPVRKVSWPTMQALDGQIYEDGFGRKWTFVLIADEQCAQTCQSNLFYMRQIRTLLARDSNRLQNVLISRSPLNREMIGFLEDYPDMVVIDNFSNNAFFEIFGMDEGGGEIGSSPKMYLVDPDRNYMMHYPASIDEHRVLEDLRKLMKLSQIG